MSNDMQDTFNYQELNFMCGLEVHQQIAGAKLFCSCSSDIQEKNEEVVFERGLRASAGEIGETDVAAQYEQAKARRFIYHGYGHEYCLVDMDEEPPHTINKKAIGAALEVALLLKLKIPDILCIMRKVITDGSCCSSFQRTINVGLETSESYLETSQGKVRIASLYLEEDACKIIRTESGKIHYSLSRQGIPLIEIGTRPDIKSPEQAKEVAEKLGMILRSTEKVRRGIGTIRQDVNVSIKGGHRVELKGFQDLRSMPKIIEEEVRRHLSETVKSEVRRVNPDGTTTFLRPMPGAARMYVETDHPLIFIDEQELKQIKLPELITEKTLRLEKQYNLSPQLAREIADDTLFETYVARFKNIEPSFLAHVLLEIPKEMKTRFKLDPGVLKETDYAFALEHHNNQVIPKSAILEMLVELAQGKKVDLGKYKAISEDALAEEIQQLVAVQKDTTINALMGMLMAKYRGKVDGQMVMKLLQKYKK